MSETARGRVLLVGAGPGDPDLITLRGAEALRRADVVVYDSLVPPELLDLAPLRAERVDVGKRSHETLISSQDEINALLVARARAGQTRGAAQGRRFVRVRARRRGGERVPRGRRSLRGGTGRDLGAGRPRLRRHPRHRPALRGVLRGRHGAPRSRPPVDVDLLGQGLDGRRYARRGDGDAQSREDRRGAAGERARPVHARRRRDGGRYAAPARRRVGARRTARTRARSGARGAGGDRGGRRRAPARAALVVGIGAALRSTGAGDARRRPGRRSRRGAARGGRRTRLRADDRDQALRRRASRRARCATSTATTRSSSPARTRCARSANASTSTVARRRSSARACSASDRAPRARRAAPASRRRRCPPRATTPSRSRRPCATCCRPPASASCSRAVRCRDRRCRRACAKPVRASTR